MAYKITISSSVQSIGEDTLQLILAFTVNDSGSDVALNMAENGIKVSDWGETDCSYNLDDLLMAVGVYTFALQESGSLLKNLFYGTADYFANVVRIFDADLGLGGIEIELKLNGITEYTGIIQEDGYSYDAGKRTLRVSIDPSTTILNSTALYAQDNVGRETDIHGWSVFTPTEGDPIATITSTDSGGVGHLLYPGDWIKLDDINWSTGFLINTFFKVASIVDDTKFTIIVPGLTGSYVSGGKVTKQEAYNPLNVYTPSTDYTPLIQTIEKIFQLVNPDISYSGGNLELLQDWIFFGIDQRDRDNTLDNITFLQLNQSYRPLYFDPSKGLNSVGDVLRKLALDWCSFTGMLHKNRAFFKKLFYYDSSDAQTLGTVLNRQYGAIKSKIDYVKTKTNASRSLTYRRGTDTRIKERRLERDMLVGFYFGQPTPDSEATNITAVISGTTYDILKVKDPSYLSAAFVDNGELVAEYWYQTRGIHAPRIDKIYVKGLKPDFLKSFVDDGHKYQPIGINKKFSTGETVIDAVYLGEALS